MGKLEGGPGPVFCLVQLLPYSSHASFDSRNGSQNYRSRMDDSRTCRGRSMTRLGCWPLWDNPPPRQINFPQGLSEGRRWGSLAVPDCPIPCAIQPLLSRLECQEVLGS